MNSFNLTPIVHYEIMTSVTVLACDQFSPRIISRQCSVVSFYQNNYILKKKRRKDHNYINLPVYISLCNLTRDSLNHSMWVIMMGVNVIENRKTTTGLELETLYFKNQ